MTRQPKPSPVQPVLIETTAALAALCERLRRHEFVTVDTEFMRERTYWPELCVVQIAGPDEVAVIDALAPGIDLAPLAALLADERVLKVFHAARQDVEIFLIRFGQAPRPLFDTQIAAMVCGFGDQVAYDSLAAKLAHAQIDKSFRFSDWSARPLSPQQTAYAAADVIHLRPIYEKLAARLARDGRSEWVAEEMAALIDPALYRLDPAEAWLRLKPRSTNRRFLGVLRAVAAWREREAQRINIPRQRVLKDESLMELAAHAPADAAALARTRGLSRGLAEGKSGAALLAAIRGALALSEEELPEAPQREPTGRASPALVALLKVLLAAKCERHHVAQKLVATSEELERLAAGDGAELPCLHGWRREVFGADALALASGQVALSAGRNRVRLVQLAGETAG